MKFKIIGGDDHVYGPIGLEELRQWVTENRVDAQTWVYDTSLDRWTRAAQIVGMADLFVSQQGATEISPAQRTHPSLRPAHLRRLKVFTDMSEHQLPLFVSLVEPVEVKANRPIVKMNEPGDCMYLILQGEVRVSQGAEGRQTTLAILETGDFFGEICLFDEGPRSADVMTVRDSTLLRITKKAFDNIIKNHPDIAARFLFAIIRSVEARVRSINKKYVDSMAFARGWTAIPTSSSPTTISPPPQRPRSKP